MPQPNPLDLAKQGNPQAIAASVQNFIIFGLLGLLASVAIACSGPKVATPPVPPPTPVQVAQPSPSPAPSPAPMPKKVSLKFKVQSGADYRPMAVGQTNLPDGTELTVGLTSKTVDFYSKDLEAVVKGGKFQSEKFEALQPGQYLMEVRHSKPSVQQVQPFYLSPNSKVTPGVNKAAMAKVRSNINAMIQAVSKLERQGMAMKPLRDNQSLAAMERCGILMRQYIRQAEKLGTQVKSLPEPFSMHLGAAAIDLKLCTTCDSSISATTCQNVREQVAEAKQALKNW